MLVEPDAKDDESADGNEGTYAKQHSLLHQEKGIELMAFFAIWPCEKPKS